MVVEVMVKPQGLNGNFSMPVGELFTISKGRKASNVIIQRQEQCSRYLQINDLRNDGCIQYTTDVTGVQAIETDIVIAWDGANAGTTGYGLDGIIGSTLARLRSNGLTELWTPYVGRFFQTKFSLLNSMSTGATIPHISRVILENIQVPLLPLAEQKRIAAILDEADALRRKRREAIAKCDTLLHSVFMKMFGNLSAFSSPECCIGDVVASTPNAIRTGPFGSQLLHSEFVGEGVAVLGIDNAVKNEFAWSQRRYITPQKYEQLKRYTVHPGDVIITIMGTCGRCAVVPDDIPVAINTKHLCCITLDKSKCLPEFLHSAFLTHPTMKRQLEDASRGAIMDGLNMGVIKNLRFPFPPLKAQQEYVAIKSNIKHQKSVARDAAQKADDLFNALQLQTFSTDPDGAKPTAQLRTLETSPCPTLDF